MRASAEQQASGETSWPGPGPTQTGWRYHKPVCSMYFRLFSLFLVQLEMKKKWVRRGRGMTTRGARAGTYQLNLLGVCYDVCTHHAASGAFSFNVCRD